MAIACKPTRSSSLRHASKRRGKRRPLSVAGFALLAFLSLFTGSRSLCRAEQKPTTKLLFLVARNEIVDPYFQRSVVLMLPIKDQPLIVGLIINKPTRLSLVKLFPESPVLKNRADMAFMGGPVDMQTPALAFHAAKPPKGAMLLYDDVYLSFDAEQIAERLADPKQAGDLRMFLGRAQWAPEQLQGEALRGSWYSLREDGEVIFDHDTEHLWDRLHLRAKPALHVEYRPSPPSAGRLHPRLAISPPSLLPSLVSSWNGAHTRFP